MAVAVATKKDSIMSNHHHHSQHQKEQIMSDMHQLKQDPALTARILQRLMSVREFRDILNRSRNFKPRYASATVISCKCIPVLPVC